MTARSLLHVLRLSRLKGKPHLYRSEGRWKSVSAAELYGYSAVGDVETERAMRLARRSAGWALATRTDKV